MDISAQNRATPMDLRYVKIMRFAMWTIGSWPGRELGERVWRISEYYIYYLHVQALTALIPVIFYVAHEAKKIPFLILGHNCITLCLSFASTAKMSLLCIRKRYREYGKIFFSKMHLIYFKNKSEYAMKTHLQVHRISELCTFYLVSMLGATIIFFNTGPIYVNYSEGLYRTGIPENSTKVYAHAAYYRFPFECNYLTNFKNYILVSLFTWNISYFCGSFLTILDCYLYITVFHIWGHFKILIHDLEMIPKPLPNPGKSTEELLLDKYSAEESKQVNEKLKRCVGYHRLIIGFTKMMSDVFGSTLMIYTGVMLVLTCLLLLECSYMNTEAFMRYGPLTLMVFQELIQFGLVFELIGTAGEKLKKVVYDLPWEYMNRENRFIVLILLMNVQKPVRVKALGVTDMGVATVASIIKTSLSYFPFLRKID
uniref:Odorant receptor n=1 Tax=Amyelois transitella TaxID=680683 RepID=J7G8K5_AMYTR|nr:odorant receptor 4 [Amyelois transitella]